MNLEIEDDDDSDYDEYSQKRLGTNGTDEPQIHLTSDGHCERLVLMSVLAPIGHTYLAVAESLDRLLDTPLVESSFIKLCVNKISSKVDTSECRYGKYLINSTLLNTLHTHRFNDYTIIYFVLIQLIDAVVFFF